MPAILGAEVVLPCDDLAATIAFFGERLGFVLDTIMPADDPQTATMSGHGIRVRFVRGASGDAGRLQLLVDDPARFDGIDGVGGVGGIERIDRAPNGTRIEFAPAQPPVLVPPLDAQLEISRAGESSAWVVGRAGMRYRDLLPARQGGRFVASHISIPDGGPVADDVHHHAIRFQVIYCLHGWVRLVYEDQGPPFVLDAGDCVLQPPGIRHRVLESSPDLEVVEVACPAAHVTAFDHDMALPTPTVQPERDFGGQRFVLHRAAGAPWAPWRLDGYDARDTGIAGAVDDLAGVRVVRPAIGPEPPVTVTRHDAELVFWFVLAGSVTVRLDDRHERFHRGDSVAVPAGLPHALEDPTPDFELLDVTLPSEP
jgi:quercetin dioxygenase-like cupin family protein